MTYAIIRGNNGRRHEVDFGDSPVRVEVYASEETVEISPAISSATREARRAVRDALPFLEQATRVTIVEACGPDDEKTALDRLNDVARYLSHHRIKCGPKIMLEQKGSGAEQLIRSAQEEQADLLVTGAYGHSRLGEWIFGGMTRELLAASPICCLMSH